MRRGAQAIAFSVGRFGGRPVEVVNAKSGTIPGALLNHLSDLRIAHLQAMFDRIAAAVERALQTDAAVGVASNFLAPAVSFVGDGLEFFDGERWLRGELTILADP